MFHQQDMDAWSLHLASLMLAITLVCNSLQLAALLLLSEATYARHRTAMCAFMRLFGMAHTACVIPPIRAVGDSDKIGFVLLYKSGILTSCYLAIIYPLKLKWHLPVQLATVVGFAAALAEASCQLTIQRPISTDAVRQLHQAFELLASIFFGLHGALYRRSSADQDGCLPTVMYTQLLLGMLLPTVMVYLFERRSRRDFLRALHSHDGVAHELPRVSVPLLYLGVLLLVSSWCLLRIYA
jgi:hypothetical protein